MKALRGGERSEEGDGFETLMKSEMVLLEIIVPRINVCWEK